MSESKANDILWGDRELARIWRPRTDAQWAALTCNVPFVLFGGSAGSYKALALDTPIPTPTGWTTMGGIAVGDRVFNEAGEICAVTGTSEIFYDKDVYEVEFDDGTIIKACGDHQWLTMTDSERMRAMRGKSEWRARRRAKRPRRGVKNTRPWLSLSNERRAKIKDTVVAGQVRTTREIAATVLYRGSRRNHSVATTKPLQTRSDILPVAPYTLGAWLGDGTADNGGLTCHGNDVETIEHIRADGYQVNKHADVYGWGIIGIRSHLRAMGISPHKRIPQRYLRASFEQRLALLQGLMDTDGSANPEKGCVLVLTNRDLIEDARELVLSLGIKANVSQYRAFIHHKDGRKQDCGWAYSISFITTLPVFRLKRKLAKQKMATRALNGRRYITAVRPVPSEPVRCIAVDSPSHLYLCSRAFIPTHNSESLMVRPLRFRDHPASQSIIFRRTSPELQQLFDRARSLYRQLGATVNGTEKIFRFPSGATVKYDFMERPDHKDRQYSNEYDFVGFDESTLMKNGMDLIRFMFSRLRSKDSSLHPYLQMDLATNPGGVGNNDHKHIFIGAQCYHCKFDADKCRIPGKVYHDATWPDGSPVGKATVFIPGRLDEAGLLGQVYRDNLLTQPNFRQKALLSGCWDITEGQYFDCWNESKMVIKRQLVGDQWWWPHWVAIDYGFQGSAAVAYLNCRAPATEDCPKGRIYTIGEIVERHMLAEDFAEKVWKAWHKDNRRIIAWYGGTDLWNKTGDGHQRADQMMKKTGMNLEMASTDRVGGAMLMYTLLRNGEWQIADTCEYAIRMIPSRVHEDSRTGDPDDVKKVKGEDLDDCYDALRYSQYSYVGEAVKPAEVRIAEAVTSSDPTTRAIQAQMAEDKIRKESTDVIPVRLGWRRNRE